MNKLYFGDNLHNTKRHEFHDLTGGDLTFKKAQKEKKDKKQEGMF